MYINQLTHDKLIDPNESLLTLYQRKAVIWNNAWFLNIRTAYGLAFFGRKWNNMDLIEKSQRIFNTLLNLPRIRGLFPSIVFPSLNNEKEIYTINGVKAFYPTSEYNVVDACIAMYWALKISIDLDMHHHSFFPCPKI